MQFIDLNAQQALIRAKIDARISAVLDHGKYIMGPEVKELEAELASFCGAQYCVSCANGTDALQLVMLALNIGPEDAVFVPSFTFAATAEAPALVGATPVFVDIDRSTFNMDTESLKRAIVHARRLGLNPKAIIAVDLFGLPANYPLIQEIADNENLKLIDDSAQGWGGSIDGRKTGSFGDVTTTSFFPAKPLGCYGDGGAIFTDNPNMAIKLDSLRVHGKGGEKYDNVRIGLNSRLDTIQAAILLEKLALYENEIASREEIAQRYSSALSEIVDVPYVPETYSSIWAQYTVKLHRNVDRGMVMKALKNDGVPSVVYYPRPLHSQSVYKDFPIDPNGLSVSEELAQIVMSLPMHPYLKPETQDIVISAVKSALQ